MSPTKKRGPQELRQDRLGRSQEALHGPGLPDRCLVHQLRDPSLALDQGPVLRPKDLGRGLVPRLKGPSRGRGLAPRLKDQSLVQVRDLVLLSPGPDHPPRENLDQNPLSSKGPDQDPGQALALPSAPKNAKGFNLDQDLDQVRDPNRVQDPGRQQGQSLAQDPGQVQALQFGGKLSPDQNPDPVPGPDRAQGIFTNKKTRPAWAGFKTAEEGRANTPFGVGGPRG